jgi:AcrR family transcriptional regulator
MAGRTGRRPGGQDTREQILAAAREVFAQRGYDRATIRQIATTAGVDPALVHHYFDTKEKLFAATVNFPMDPAEFVPRALAGPVEGAGARLVRTFLAVWDSPVGAAGVALLRSAVSSELAARLLREFLTTQILRRAMATLRVDPSEAAWRSSLIASQISGLGLTRYILKVEPLASLPPEAVVAAIGPTIQRYLTGDLPPPPADQGDIQPDMPGSGLRDS